MPPLLEASGIGRRIHGSEQWLLREISFTLAAGERLAISGPTGSGKSLLLRALAGLDPIDAGEVRLAGRVYRGGAMPGYRARVLYLAQKPWLTEGTVEKNLCLPFEFAVHEKKSFDRGWAVAELKQLGRDESFLDKKQQNLSGGERQIAALLRAIQLQPEVLLLDEPTSAIDADSAELVEQLVLSWLEGQPDERAFIWVSHDRAQLDRATERTLFLAKGRLAGEDG